MKARVFTPFRDRNALHACAVGRERIGSGVSFSGLCGGFERRASVCVPCLLDAATAIGHADSPTRSALDFGPFIDRNGLKACDVCLDLLERGVACFSLPQRRRIACICVPCIRDGGKAAGLPFRSSPRQSEGEGPRPGGSR